MEEPNIAKFNLGSDHLTHWRIDIDIYSLGILIIALGFLT